LSTDHITTTLFTHPSPLPPSLQHYSPPTSVDPTPALAIPGVVRFVSHKDVPGGNKIGAVVKDEECFATQEVHHVGAVIGIIVAESEAAAQVGV
jgi:xanthine dehydrogenase/oxidase